MTVKTMPLQELTTTTIELLCREIGVVNTARFLSQFTAGHGDYTQMREQLIGNLMVDDIVGEIQRKRASTQNSQVKP